MGQMKSRQSFASRLSRPLLAGTLAAGAAGAAMPATASDIFLNLEGIKGESTDSKHRDEITIFSYTQSFVNNQVITAGDGGGGQVTCGAVTVLKDIDRSSPELIKLVTTGTHVRSGVVTLRASGGSKIEYYKVLMKDVIVTGVNQSETREGTRIVERVTLLADTFEFDYTPIDSKGVPGATVRYAYDCTNSKI